MIKNIIFDVGGVLVDFRWRALMEDLGISGALRDEFGIKVFGSKWWGEFDKGALDEDYVIGKIREDIKEHVGEFERIWENRVDLVESFDYVNPWMDSLKERGFKLYLLSNYPKSMFELHEKKGRFTFIDKVDGKVVSGFIGMVKPDADIYEHIIEKYNLKPDECVFIDDRADNIKAAEAFGMKGIVFENYDKASKELENLLK